MSTGRSPENANLVRDDFEFLGLMSNETNRSLDVFEGGFSIFGDGVSEHEDGEAHLVEFFDVRLFGSEVMITSTGAVDDGWWRLFAGPKSDDGASFHQSVVY